MESPFHGGLTRGNPPRGRPDCGRMVPPRPTRRAVARPRSSPPVARRRPPDSA